MPRSRPSPCEQARAHLEASRPVLHNDLMQVAALHWALPPEALEAVLPEGLGVDVWRDEAYVSALALWSMRMCVNGPGGARLGLPAVSNHPQLNVRTYVTHRATGQPGVAFIQQFIPRPVAVFFARRLFHMPYTLGELDLEHPEAPAVGEHVKGRMVAADASLTYELEITSPPHEAAADGLGEFLMERYFAFAPSGGDLLEVGIHHEPWPLQECAIARCDATSFLASLGEWTQAARLRCAMYSPGAATRIYRPVRR